MNPVGSNCDLEEGMNGLDIEEREYVQELDEDEEPYSLSDLNENDAPSQNRGYDSHYSAGSESEDQSGALSESSSEDDDDDEYDIDDDSINGESSNIYDYDGVEDDDKLYFEKYDYEVNSVCCRLNSTSDDYSCPNGGQLAYVITNPANCTNDNCFKKYIGNTNNLTKIESVFNFILISIIFGEKNNNFIFYLKSKHSKPTTTAAKAAKSV
jgi:hypothetical protein